MIDTILLSILLHRRSSIQMKILFFRVNVMYSDENDFCFKAYDNKQNYRICRKENPHADEEIQLHPVTVGLPSIVVVSMDFIFSQNDRVTVHEVRYQTMLNDDFFPTVIENQLEDFWFSITSL